MAFIEKKDPVVINIKLTSRGRELLSQGKLNFQYFAVGDSEIDYNFISEAQLVDSEFSAYNLGVLRPADKNPNLLSFVTKTVSGDPYNEISSVPTSPYIVSNTVDSLGFFSNITSTGATIITDSNHVKQPDAMVAISGVTGGTELTLVKAPTYGTSSAEPAIGDIVLVKWTFGFDTTGNTVQKTFPTPYLFYRIVNKSGMLSTNNLVIEVDRELPDFTGMALSDVYAGALIYYDFINFSGNTVFNMSSTDYLDESVLSFLENSQCPTIVFPFWNMSIVFTEEIAGVQSVNMKFTEFNSRVYAGFVSYIQNQAPVYKKLGIIHYTNSSPANVYAEGFYLNTPKLNIPTIMWHKSQNGTMGVTLSAYGNRKILTNPDTGATSLNVEYYDLADENGNVVGKVFTELKIFVIEDQELLFAMSYKSNRNWTLPDYVAGTTEILTVPCPDCPPSPPEGPTVTWKTPTNTSTIGGVIGAQYYCYNSFNGNVGWTSFPAGCTITRSGVFNTGYRVIFGGPNGGGGAILAIDEISSIPICQYSNGGGPGSTITYTLSNINNLNDYCFTGSFS